MKWNEMKDMVERFVPEAILNDYLICIEIINAGAEASDTFIEIDNKKCEISIHD